MKNILFFGSFSGNLLLVILLISANSPESALKTFEHSIPNDKKVACSNILAYELEQASSLNDVESRTIAREVVIGDDFEIEGGDLIVLKELEPTPSIESTEALQSIYAQTKRYKVANPDMPLAAEETELILTLSQFSSEDVQLDALDLVEDSLNDEHLILLNEYIFSNSLKVQEEAFIRLTEIGISEHSVELFEYYQNHPSDWIQHDARAVLQEFYQQ